VQVVLRHGDARRWRRQLVLGWRHEFRELLHEREVWVARVRGAHGEWLGEHVLEPRRRERQPVRAYLRGVQQQPVGLECGHSAVGVLVVLRHSDARRWGQRCLLVWDDHVCELLLHG